MGLLNLQHTNPAITALDHQLIVEGGEGGGFKNAKDVSTMVLVPQVVEAVDVPVVAAGGIMDGRTMAAAFALGAAGGVDQLAEVAGEDQETRR